MTNSPTIKQLRYLLVLSQTRNFTKAAELCFVGQSTLSAGLKELEDSLGVQLVERDKHSVSLTPIGIEVVGRAKVILGQTDDLVDYAKSSTGAMKGMITFGVIPTIAPFVLPWLLPKMRLNYPELKIIPREDLTVNLIDKLGRHELDFVLIALPYPTEGYLIKEVFDDEFWLVGKPDDPVLKNKDVQLTNKMSNQILFLEEGHCLREHALKACKRSALPADALEATSLLTLVQMIESGLGLALLPEMAIKGGILKQTKLIARPLASPAPKRRIALMARLTTARIEAFNALVQTLKAWP